MRRIRRKDTEILPQFRRNSYPKSTGAAIPPWALDGQFWCANACPECCLPSELCHCQGGAL
jgi:hypothetical protein